MLSLIDVMLCNFSIMLNGYGSGTVTLTLIKKRFSNHSILLNFVHLFYVHSEKQIVCRVEL